MKKWFVGILSVAALAVLIVSFLVQHRLRQENMLLREQVDRLTAAMPPLSDPLATPVEPPRLSDEDFRELLKLRGEVTLLRQQQDDLLRQMAQKTTPPRVSAGGTDEAWVKQVLESAPKTQGTAAGSLRGKLLRREMTNISAAEIALKEELLHRQLNQTLERSPDEFADFQSGFIGSVLGISDETKIRQIHDLIQKTYESAVANGLDIPSKPATGTEEWVQRRFNLDRAATAQLHRFLTDEERRLFDRAFLGVMGVDLGGVGVDRSNYPKGFFGPD